MQHINSDQQIKLLLEAIQKEYPFAAKGLTRDRLHTILDNHSILIYTIKTK